MTMVIGGFILAFWMTYYSESGRSVPCKFEDYLKIKPPKGFKISIGDRKTVDSISVSSKEILSV